MKGLAGFLLVIVIASACSCGRDERAPGSGAPTSEAGFDGRPVVLGATWLTAGIPGEGPLKVAEIRRWLANPHVHETLDFKLPSGLAEATSSISIPPENPLTVAKIELGRQLFFDKRLSGFGTFACATCHIPEQDFSAYMVMPDVERNPPVTFNRLFSVNQFWDGHATSLEHQPTSPIKNPFEMNTTPQACVETLRGIEGYRIQFEAIFGKLDFQAVGFALASFQRVLVTGNSAWDDHRLLAEAEAAAPPESTKQDPAELAALRRRVAEHPMSAAALRGQALFFSDRTRCSWCHPGPNLTDELYHNVGIGMAAEKPDLGRYRVTSEEADRGGFKTPTLRNVARTPPYMHNGQFDTLKQVVDWFAQGGFEHQFLDESIQPLDLSTAEKRDLVEFLKALTCPLPPVETARLPE